MTEKPQWTEGERGTQREFRGRGDTQGVMGGRTDSGVRSLLYSPADFSPESCYWSEVLSETAMQPSEPQFLAMPPQYDGNTPSNAMLPLLDLKKRGRKPNRPNDPIRKKTEEKDKYWLRAFRAFMKTYFLTIRKGMNAEERFFWRDYLGPEGKPEKGNRFSSFGRQYKNALFSSESFVHHFQQWFLNFGEKELLKKYPKNTPLWFVFYDYAATELFNYNPNLQHKAEESGAASSAAQTSPEQRLPRPYPNYSIPTNEDECQGDVDMFLERL